MVVTQTVASNVVTESYIHLTPKPHSVADFTSALVTSPLPIISFAAITRAVTHGTSVVSFAYSF